MSLRQCGAYHTTYAMLSTASAMHSSALELTAFCTYVCYALAASVQLALGSARSRNLSSISSTAHSVSMCVLHTSARNVLLAALLTTSAVLTSNEVLV